jgi:Zn-finger nucleic acid-binding protein
MKYPFGSEELKMVDRQSIEFKYSLKCRGWWLGRGTG